MFWEKDWRNICRHWQAKPDNLKPLQVEKTIQHKRGDKVNYNDSLAKIGMNPYRGSNLEKIMLLYAGFKLPKSTGATKIHHALLGYRTQWEKDRGYLVSHQQDIEWGSEYLLAVLLPILYGRLFDWKELEFIKGLTRSDISLLTSTLLEQKPDVWWPFYMKGRIIPPSGGSRKDPTVISMLKNNPRGMSMKEICETLGPSAKHLVSYYSRRGRVEYDKGVWKLVAGVKQPATSEILRILANREMSMKEICDELGDSAKHSVKYYVKTKKIKYDGSVYKLK